MTHNKKHPRYALCAAMLSLAMLSACEQPATTTTDSDGSGIMPNTDATVIHSDGGEQYVIYFALDSAVLDAPALQVSETLFSSLKQHPNTTLSISGHADTTGEERYNMLLSNERANNVKAQFTAMGLPETQIETFGFGETDLAVPTPDDTLEPLNRRVEIVLSK